MPRFKRAAAAICQGSILALALTGTAYGTNWLMLDATVPPATPALTGSLFASVEYQASQDTPLLAGPWAGQPDQFNRFAPNYEDGEVFRLSQAGVGLQGLLMSGAIAYRATLLTGDNAILRNERGFYDGRSIRPTDASITINSLPRAHLRLGLFRQPLGDEAIAPQQRYIWLSHVTQQMVQERYFRSDGSSNGDPNFDRGPPSGFRDSGIELFDSFVSGAWEHTYGAMLGLGTGVDPRLDHSELDQYVYWSSEWIFGKAGRLREGLKLYAWRQSGERTLRTGSSQLEQDFDRRRAGVGASLRSGSWFLASEWITAKGMIYHGPDGGTVPGRISNDGRLVSGYNVLPNSKADGGYIDIGYRLLPPLELLLRYDRLNRATDRRETEIRFEGMTLGLNYQMTSSIQVTADYQFRRYQAPRLAHDTTTNALLDGVDNRFGLRVAYQFGF